MQEGRRLTRLVLLVLCGPPYALAVPAVVCAVLPAARHQPPTSVVGLFIVFAHACMMKPSPGPITARPDIEYAVGKLSRGMHQPNKLHRDMFKDVVGYLRNNTIALPLRFTRKPSKISFLFAELNSGDAVLSEFHNHSCVEGEIVDVPLCKMHPDPLVNVTDRSYSPQMRKTVVRFLADAISTSVILFRGGPSCNH